MPSMTPAERETKLNEFVNAPEPTPATPAAQAAPTTAAADTKIGAPDASATPAATPEGAPAASTATGGPSDWIVAKRGDEEFKIPADAVLEFKRHDQTLTATMDEFRRQGMMGTDYKLRKEQFETERQAVQRQREQDAVIRARLEERQKYLDEQERAFREAQTDPAKFEQWQSHLQQLQTNPRYRQAFEAELAKRETDAENQMLRERAQEEYVQRATATVEGWMGALKDKYPGVPIEAVQREYAARVSLWEQQQGRMGTLGDGPLTPAALEEVFKHHAGVFSKAVEPVQARVAALEAELKALKANAQTEHVVQRGKAPPTAPVPGAPAAPSKRTPRYETPEQREERLAAFLRDA